MAPCSFTFLFDAPQNGRGDREETLTDSYTYYSSSSSSCSSPVDCTLSLGTASTRRSGKSPQRNAGTCMPSIRWNIFSQPKSGVNAGGGNGGNGSLSGGAGNDPLLVRRCANCDTTSTPLWRNGPRGPKSLCNACGIRYKKEERRAAATIAASESQKPQYAAGSYGYQNESQVWGYSASQRSSSSCGELRFIHGCDSANDSALPYLSWGLNVPQPRAEYLHQY